MASDYKYLVIIAFIAAVAFVIYYTQFMVRNKTEIDESIEYLKQNRAINRRNYVPNASMYEAFENNFWDDNCLSEMAGDILRHLGLPNTYIPVHVVESMQGKAVGLYKQSGNGSSIEINISQFAVSNEVMAVLIHETMHYYLTRTGLGFSDTLKNEILTDTATIYFGFYEFIHNGYLHAGYIRYSEIKYIEKILRG